MKRLMALLLMLCIALTGMALAEDELYEEVDDSEFNEDEVIHVVGAVYPDKVLSDFDSNSPALYTARMTAYTSGYVDRDIESTRVFRVGDTSARGEVLYVDPTWVIMRYQGKLAYAKKQNPYIHWTDGELCEGDNIFEAEGVFHFEKYIQSMIKKENWSEKEAIDFASKLTKKCPDIVIVTQEIGYGLVPVDAFDRRYRELTGRICTVLAANSDQVDRVVCGIGVTIKGGNIK